MTAFGSIGTEGRRYQKGGMTMKRVMIPAVACVAIVVSCGFVSAQQRGQPQSQRRVAPVPPAKELFYRTFTAAQLAQADQPVQHNPTARRGPAVVPNTANVVEEIFKRGLGPIVLGIPGQMNADGTPKPSVVLKSQRDVAALMQTSPSGSSDTGGAAEGRRMGPPPTGGITRLQKNLVALKVNMIICGNGITVNDPGDPFRDLYLAPGFDVAEGPIYDNCFQCYADGCPGTCSFVFMRAGIKCRCYWPLLPAARASSPSAVEEGDSTLPRRLNDLAAYADNMLTNLHGFSEDDFEEINQTIEVVNNAFAGDLPFGPEDIEEWGGPDGRLVLTSVRPLSEVLFLVNKP